MSWLSLVEYWYNSSFHSSLNCEPTWVLSTSTGTWHTSHFFNWGHRPLSERKTGSYVHFLIKAQARMKQYEDKGRTERELKWRWVIKYTSNYSPTVKWQCHRKGIGCCQVLRAFWGVGTCRDSSISTKVTSARVHPVFHVSQFQQKIGNGVISVPELPIMGPRKELHTEPDST